MIPTSRQFGGVFVARRRNRRWVVALYWGFIVPTTAFVVGRLFARPHEWFIDLVSVVMVANLYTMSRVGLKPMGSLLPRLNQQDLEFLKGPKETKDILADWNWDERESRQRDQVLARAYQWSLAFAFAVFAGMAVLLVVQPEWARWAGPVSLCLLIAAMAGLPQTIALWTLRDEEEVAQ